jgi:hypothetical protein
MRLPGGVTTTAQHHPPRHGTYGLVVVWPAHLPTRELSPTSTGAFTVVSHYQRVGDWSRSAIRRRRPPARVVASPRLYGAAPTIAVIVWMPKRPFWIAQLDGLVDLRQSAHLERAAISRRQLST